MADSALTTTAVCRRKRSPLLAAVPPHKKLHCQEQLQNRRPESEDSSVEICVVCKSKNSTQHNPLQLPSPKTWNLLAGKAQEWKGLDSNYSSLHANIRLEGTPLPIHKICKLNITGNRLKKAKEANRKSIIAQNAALHQTVKGSPSRKRCRSDRSSGHKVLTCVFCKKPLSGRYFRSSSSRAKVAIKHHRIETEDSWNTFVKSVQYVEDRIKKNRLQALVAFCQNAGGITTVAALDIRYHRIVGKHTVGLCGMKQKDKKQIRHTKNGAFG